MDVTQALLDSIWNSLGGKADAARKALTAAGQLGASKAKEIMSSGEGFAPLTPGALRSRVARAMRGKGVLRRRDGRVEQRAAEAPHPPRRGAVQAHLLLRLGGLDPADAGHRLDQGEHLHLGDRLVGLAVGDHLGDRALRVLQPLLDRGPLAAGGGRPEQRVGALVRCEWR